MQKFVDAFIISWPGKHECAEHIAAQLVGSVDRLTVLYANRDDLSDGREAPWVQFPDSWYFGAQFAGMIERFNGDVLLHIMADASCDDWPGLVSSLRDAYKKVPATGVWSPNVDHSAHPIHHITVGDLPGSPLHLVSRTDCTVWALARDVIDHMRKLDYTLTPLGWGIDLAAAMFCHTSGRPVVMDTSIAVTHPHSTGYDGADAHLQMVRFLAQLTPRQTLLRLALTRRLPPQLRSAIFGATRSSAYKKMVSAYSAGR